jgi:hypothetical protein
MQVPDRVFHLADPVPAFPYLEERVLCDVLGLRPAPRDREQDLVEAESFGREELLERRRRTHGQFLADVQVAG